MSKKLTELEVIQRLKEVHGDKYSYDDMELVNAKTPLKIFCNKHNGYFYQRFDVLLKAGRCSVCQKKEYIEDLLKRFNKIHSNKYDYSQVEFVSTIEKIRIGCEKHGFFKLSPKKHLTGQGCPKCKGYERLTTSQLIKKFKKVHNCRYTYPKKLVISSDKKIEIMCADHGVFTQSIYRHANGSGCPKCALSDLAKKNSLSKDTFIKGCNEKHNSFYDYTKTEYENYNSIIVVTCPDHGDFSVKASNHIRGSKCPKCAKLIPKNYVRKSREAWIKDFVAKHGDFYIYDKAEITHRNTPIEIVCPKHKSFWLSPNAHLRGYGCKLCSGARMTQEQFITRARAIFGLEYDYSDVKFTKVDSKVNLKCRKHGSFEMYARTHLGGAGCRQCAHDNRRKRLEEIIAEFVNTHGYYYNYDQVVYGNAHSLITIKCPKHGDFQQRVSAHKKGGRCPKCR